MDFSLDRPQQVRVGGRVVWDAVSSNDPHHLVEGEVESLSADTVVVQPVSRWMPSPDGWRQEPVIDEQIKSIPRRYFETPLRERWNDTEGGIECIPKVLS